jgi:DNA-binding transcriptional regulator LsrR (DeoR family)
MGRPKQKALDTFQIAGVAYLKAKGVKNRDIATRLSLSESMVSRLLAPDGEANKFLRIPPPVFVEEALDPIELARVRQLQGDDSLSRALSDQLTSISNGIQVSVHVIDSTLESKYEHYFYDRAAVVVWDHLSRGAGTIGVSWGRKIENLIEAAKRRNLGSRFKADQQPKIIPLAGESLGSTHPTSVSSSSLAQALRDLLTPGSEDHLSLTIVPSLIPGTFSDGKLNAIKELLSHSIAYREIFDDDEAGLADSLDVVLTSCSRDNKPFGFGGTRDYDWKDLELGRFKELLIGDMGGVPLFREPRAGEELQRQQKDLLNRWTGVKAKHIRNCAKRANANPLGPAGVILITMGAERVATVVEAVRQGFVNVLICCDSIAPAIQNILRPQGSKKVYLRVRKSERHLGNAGSKTADDPEITARAKR